MTQDFRLVPFAGAALIGAEAGLHLDGGIRFAQILMVGSVVVGAAAVVVFRYRGHAALLVLLAVLLAGAGVCGTTVFHRWVSQPSDLRILAQKNSSVVIVGTVVGRPENLHTTWGPDSCSVTVEVDTAEPKLAEFRAPRSLGAALHKRLHDGQTLRHDLMGSAVYVALSGDVCDAREGQWVAAAGKLSVPPHPGHPVAVLRAVDLVWEGKGTPGARVVAAIDTRLTGLLDGRPAHAQGLIPGVALGDDSRLESDINDSMKVTQLTHLIAVSGGHISILTGIVIVIVGRRKPRITALLCALALGGLIVIVGPAASVMRAAAMAVVVIAAMAIGRSTQATAALSTALIGTALIDPWLVTHYGFLLSASATAGIVWAGGPLTAYVARYLPRGISEMIAIPLVAQLACVPVLALFSSVGSVWGVLANVLVAPVVAPLTVCGVGAAVAALFLPILATLLLLPAQMCTWWISAVATTLARWPGSGIPLWWATAGTVVLLCALLAMKYRVVTATLSLSVIGASLWWGRSPGNIPPPDDWVVVQCDVGQGSALIARGENETVMVDVGPEGDAAADCLVEAGVDHLDVLVLSHFHADHVGGLPQVLSSTHVDEVWISPNHDPQENARWVEEQLTRAGIPTREVVAGERFGEGPFDGLGERSHEVSGEGPSEGDPAIDAAAASAAPDTADHRVEPLMEVLWPRADYSGDANNSSLVVSLNVAGGVLVLADTEEEAQRRYAASVPKVRTLIMAHHGSSSQSKALATSASPQTVLISVGENTYGHPSPKAIALYGFADMYDTLTCGAIALDSEGTPRSRCEGPSR